MKKKRKYIYESPKRYSKKCGIPLDLARRRCRYFKKLNKKANKVVCPVCRKRALIYEMGSYEEGYDDFLECNNCGSAFEPEEVKNSDLLSMGGTFDEVLYFSIGKTREEKFQDRIVVGAETQEEWVNFVRYTTKRYL